MAISGVVRKLAKCKGTVSHLAYKWGTPCWLIKFSLVFSIYLLPIFSVLMAVFVIWNQKVNQMYLDEMWFIQQCHVLFFCSHIVLNLYIIFFGLAFLYKKLKYFFTHTWLCTIWVSWNQFRTWNLTCAKYDWIVIKPVVHAWNMQELRSAQIVNL